ncbi:MAG: SRPBCC family protein [Pseudomonadota bacterium]
MPKIVLTSDIAASPELLWRAIKGFSRQVELQGMGRLVERLEQITERERIYRYAIVDSPLPVANCTVEVRVIDKGDGTASVAWQSSFETGARGELQAVQTLQRLTQSALDNLQRQFGGKP